MQQGLGRRAAAQTMALPKPVGYRYSKLVASPLAARARYRLHPNILYACRKLTHSGKPPQHLALLSLAVVPSSVHTQAMVPACPRLASGSSSRQASGDRELLARPASVYARRARPRCAAPARSLRAGACSSRCALSPVACRLPATSRPRAPA